MNRRSLVSLALLLFPAACSGPSSETSPATTLAPSVPDGTELTSPADSPAVDNSPPTDTAPPPRAAVTNPQTDAGADAADAADASPPPPADAGADAAHDAAPPPPPPPPAPACGDGHVDPGEACDDGNKVNGDGCSDTCTVEPPPPPPPNCTPGAMRCNAAYQQEACINDAWAVQNGSQACCYDARFSVVGSTVHDATTGTVWYRYGGSGGSMASSNQTCGALITGGRLPTPSELAAILIGPPINNHSVCSPMVDQVAFQGVRPGVAWASGGGCVSLYTGASVACTSASTFLCIGQ